MWSSHQPAVGCIAGLDRKRTNDPAGFGPIRIILPPCHVSSVRSKISYSAVPPDRVRLLEDIKKREREPLRPRVAVKALVLATAHRSNPAQMPQRSTLRIAELALGSNENRLRSLPKLFAATRPERRSLELVIISPQYDRYHVNNEGLD